VPTPVAPISPTGNPSPATTERVGLGDDSGRYCDCLAASSSEGQWPEWVATVERPMRVVGGQSTSAVIHRVTAAVSKHPVLLQDRLDAVISLPVGGGWVRGDQFGNGEFSGQASIEHRAAVVMAGA
jgi:hypothetical protein